MDCAICGGRLTTGDRVVSLGRYFEGDVAVGSQPDGMAHLDHVVNDPAALPADPPLPKPGPTGEGGLYVTAPLEERVSFHAGGLRASSFAGSEMVRLRHPSFGTIAVDRATLRGLAAEHGEDR